MNLLVSLAWPNHVHHRHAIEWFRGRTDRGWATTAFTEAGFVRVSSNAAAIPTAVPPADAIGMLRRMREVPGHQYLVDDVEGVVGTLVPIGRVTTVRMVTDAHLLALARRHGARLVTHDRALVALAGGDALLVPLA